MAQVTPTNPAPYPLDKSYGTVTSNTVGPDGKVTGGETIAQQYQDNNKAAGLPVTYMPNAGAKVGGGGASANYKM